MPILDIKQEPNYGQGADQVAPPQSMNPYADQQQLSRFPKAEPPVTDDVEILLECKLISPKVMFKYFSKYSITKTPVWIPISLQPTTDLFPM